MRNYMNHTINIIAGLSCLALAFTGCYSIDETQKEWTDKGEKIYVGKIDSLKVRSGMNRVEIVGNTNYLRTATECTVSYDDRTVTFNISDIIGTDGKARMLIDGLEGGSYYFDVFTYDAAGNRSVPSQVYGKAYGINDVLKETPKRITTFVPKYDGSVDVEWNEASSTYYLFKWEDEDGKMQEMKIEDSPAKTNVKSWKKGGTISVQTFIMKNKNDLDLLALEPVEYVFPTEVEESIPRFGEGSYMNLGPYGDWDLGEEFTVELRARYTELASGDQCIISCESSGPSSGFMLRSSGNKLQFYIGDGGWKGTSYSTLSVGVWYDIAVTYKANTGIALYVNGELKSSGKCGKMNTPTSRLQVGTSPFYSNRYMRGDVQHVSIWRDAKSAEQIKADVEQGYGFKGGEDGLKAYWPMIVNYGDEVPDQTGQHVAVFNNVKWNKK